VRRELRDSRATGRESGDSGRLTQQTSARKTGSLEYDSRLTGSRSSSRGGGRESWGRETQTSMGSSLAAVREEEFEDTVMRDDPRRKSMSDDPREKSEVTSPDITGAVAGKLDLGLSRPRNSGGNELLFPEDEEGDSFYQKSEGAECSPVASGESAPAGSPAVLGEPESERLSSDHAA